MVEIRKENLPEHLKNRYDDLCFAFGVSEKSILDEYEHNQRWVDYTMKLDEGIFELSASKLNAFDDSPFLLMDYITQKRETTKAMMLGRMRHKLILEYDLFFQEYLILPKDTKLNTLSSSEEFIGKIEFAQYEKLAISLGISEENIIGKSDFEDALLVKELLYKYPETEKILKRSVCSEKEINFEYSYNNYTFKFRGFIDKLLTNNAALELKNINNIKWWQNEIVDNNYLQQAIIYLIWIYLQDISDEDHLLFTKEEISQKASFNAVTKGEFYFLITAKKSAMSPVKISAERLNFGLQQLHKNLDQIILCHRHGDWTKSKSYHSKKDSDFIIF